MAFERMVTPTVQNVTSERSPLRLVLLPGMDGTGDLFSELVQALPSWIKPEVVRYPADSLVTLTQLSGYLQGVLSATEPFVIMAESFSSPLAVQFAASAPKHLRGLVICAGFIVSPVHGPVRLGLALAAPVLFRLGMPAFMIKRLLLGKRASPNLLRRVREAISSVSPDVMVHRIRAVLSCDARAELRSISVPILYIAATEDRLVKQSSITVIQNLRPDVSVARIEGHHLILQSEPQQAASVLLDFARRVAD